MNNKKDKAFLKAERDLTDTSLNTERDKTDDSLFDNRKKAEQHTDAKVKGERKEADRARDNNRAASDQKTSADHKLNKQRSIEDKNVQSERKLMDQAIHEERVKKEKVLIEFLQIEREETDENLSRERTRTDDAVIDSTKLLLDEKTSHTATKATLTSRDEFIGIVSHDLRNPIGAVLSCADMLLEDSNFGSLENEAKYWIAFIKRNAETSLRLISDILDMERITEGKLQIVTKPNDLVVVLREVVESLAYSASSKQILLRSVNPKIPAILNFDRDRIAQVVSNLVSNAIKFSKEGSSISVKIVESETKFEVQVIDNGVGIPKELQEQIFTKYSQLGSKNRQGLGLGLYITKTIVESHHGTIWVTSEVGKGSVFSFSLPKHPAQVGPNRH